VFAVFSPSPAPFIALMALGFLVGVTGHIYRSRALIATGIGLIFIATLLLPLALYAHGLISAVARAPPAARPPSQGARAAPR
jgi:hypothetical protein